MSGETIITIVGNLTADPELRFTPSGQGVASFTIASTPRTFDKQTNAWKDGEALFMRCSAWRDLGEHVAESLQRGARVVATGRLKQRSYEKDGQTRTVVELDVEEIGPSLRYAVAKVNKMDRTSGNGGGQQTSPRAAAPASNDPWASTTAPTRNGGGFGEDQPPF